MATTEIDAVVLSRRKLDLDDLDYKRKLIRAHNGGVSQVDLARALGIAQPSVSDALKRAKAISTVPDGFSGATPTEICKRYAVGEIDRADLVDQLARFPYASGGSTDGYDSLIVDAPGTWAEVDAAVDEGLIDEEIYEDVFNRRHP